MSGLQQLLAQIAEQAERDRLLGRMRASDIERAANPSRDVFGKTYSRPEHGTCNEQAADWLLAQRRTDKPMWSLF